MAIKSIELKNFTVFEDFKCEFSPRINVLIGENGTGKTHLLKVLYAFCNTSTRDYSLPVELGRLFNSNPTIKGILNRNPNEDIKLKIQINGKKYDYTLSCNDDSARYSGNGSQIDEEIFSVLIPAKEMLSISNIVRIGDKYKRTLAFDNSLLAIIEKAQNLNFSEPPKLAEKILPKLEKIIDGTVFVKESDLTFWVRKTDGKEILFAMEAEGIRKFGLLWQLIMNGNIDEGTILLWDEPESNLNPKLLPVFVEVLMELAKNGVQIFLATHEYNLMKYFSIWKKGAEVAFISLRKSSGVVAETADDYNLLENNAIVDATIKLLEDDIMGDF
ncbi:MAG: AAA family ATPase [Defluviitaleaceae bacterium]|nr:AAA family ATPase [Defluviitaleaceae bacterium]